MQLIHTVYEPRGDGPHPTVLMLHGWGANAMDLLGLAPYLAGGQCLVICPQGPTQLPPEYGMVGYGWYPIVPGAGTPPDVTAIRAASDQLLGFLDGVAARYAIDPDKLIVLGFSQGGVMAYTLALSAPDRFAALIALSTWLPLEVLTHVDNATALQKMPTLVQHGSRDEMIRVDRARTSVETLRESRVPLTYQEYDMGHEINGQSLTSLSTWLREKVLTPVVSP